MLKVSEPDRSPTHHNNKTNGKSSLRFTQIGRAKFTLIMPCTEEEDRRSNSANPHRFTTVGIGIVASSTQIDSANAVVATGQIGRMCQLAIVIPMVLSIRTTMKMVSGNLRFQCKIPIFVPGNHCVFSLVWRCDIFARPQPNQSTKIGLCWRTTHYQNNLRGYRKRETKVSRFFVMSVYFSGHPKKGTAEKRWGKIEKNDGRSDVLPM